MFIVPENQTRPRHEATPAEGNHRLFFALLPILILTIFFQHFPGLLSCTSLGFSRIVIPRPRLPHPRPAAASGLLGGIFEGHFILKDG